MAETRRVSKEVAGVEYVESSNLRRVSKAVAMIEAQWSTQFDGMVRDNKLSGPLPTNNYAAETVGRIGWFTGYADGYRHILAFETSLPTGSQVFSATLSQYFDAQQGTAPAFKIYRMTATDWVEAEATYNVKATGVPWVTPGGDYDNSVYVAHAGVAEAGQVDIDVTALIQAAMTAGQTTIGLIMVPDAGSGTNYNNVRTKDHATASSRPIIRIDYGTAANYDRLSTITAQAELRAEIGGDADWRSDMTHRRLTGVSAMLEWAPHMRAYIDFTPGGTDGTQVSIDGSATVPIDLSGVPLGTALPFALRCTDGYRAPVPVIVTAPDYFDVSADGDAWGATASITVGDVNVPVYLRQTAALPRGSASVWRLLIDYGGALVEGIVPTLSGTLTLTPAAHSLLADGPDATDASGIDHYEWQIANNSAFVAPSSSTSAVSAQTFASLSEEVDYYVRYRAVDAYGNASAWLTAHSKPADTTAPSQVTGLAATNGDTQSVLTWTAATDARSAQANLRYKVYKDGVYLATTTAGALTYTATGLTNGTPVTFTVSALDEANNEGAVSEGKTATPASAGFTDNFDRASLGSTWNATGGGSLSISANKLAIGGSSGWTWANANAGATVLNARVSVKYKTGTVGVFLRRNGFESYAFTIDANAVSRVRKTSSATGEYANLGSVGWGYPADGDKLTLEINGSTIKAYKNDVLKLTVSDAQFPGAGAFGVMSTSTGCTADDFVMEVL